MFRSAKSYPRESGQALLIILLVMAVVLTIALSLVSRSVTDISISKKDEEASRAFSAAEAGVEQALSGATTLSGNLPNNIGSFDVVVTGLVTNGQEFIVPLLLASGETAPLWLVEHDDNGILVCDATHPCFTGTRLQVCWGAEGTSPSSSLTPAVEISILYTQSSDPTNLSSARIARAAFDPWTGRPDPNNFTKGTLGDCTLSGQKFAFSQNVDLTALGVESRPSSSNFKGPILARLRMFYNTDQAHPIAISVIGNELLPRQGDKVESKGTAGEATRKLEVYKLFSDLPPVFDYALFGGTGSIVK